MELFGNTHDPADNLLPFDGEVHYYGPVIDQEEANIHLGTLLDEIEWRNDEAVIFGRRIVTRRKVAWYGNTGFRYTYSNVTRTALPWTAELRSSKKLPRKSPAKRTIRAC